MRFFTEKGNMMKLKKLLPAGRADLLFFLALGVGIFLLILGAFLLNLWVLLVAALPVGYALFRIYSPNLQAREKENVALRKFCGFCIKKVKKLLIVLLYENTGATRACPECGAEICFDERAGVYYTTCSKCGCRFLVDFSRGNGAG